MKSLSMLTNKQKKALSATAVTLLVALGIIAIDDELNSIKGGYISQIRRTKKSGRGLSLNLGGGDCEWKEPLAVVPEEIDLFKTLLVGFPSGDKRMAYVQMEALTGLPSKDDWDFVYNGYSNAPFIKTNYPHPAGTWSWGDEADQVALVLQYIRRSMVEYSDIMWYMSYETEYNKDRVKVEEMYGQRLDLDNFYIWRDQHVIQEVYKYGWYIDYWLESGFFRDPYTHVATCQDSWDMYANPVPISNARDKVTICKRTNSKSNPTVELEISSMAVQAHLNKGAWYGSCADAQSDVIFMRQANNLKNSPPDKILICHRTFSETNPQEEIEVSEAALPAHLDHGDYIGTCEEAFEDPVFNTVSPNCTTPVADPNCDSVTGTCRPVMIISADKLRDYTEGPAETEIIGNILKTNEKMAKWVINEETWPCIWDKVIDKNEGPMTFDDRNIAEDPNFSVTMIEAMIEEVTRLITKYSMAPWTDDVNASRVVSLLSEHLPLLQTELADLNSGRRTLSRKDIFAPGERELILGQTSS